MDDDNLQHNLACGGARFVEDLRVLEGGRIEAVEDLNPDADERA